jgi:hypothetical protein
MRVLDILKHGSDGHAHEILRRKNIHVWKELSKLIFNFLFEKHCQDNSRPMVLQRIQSPLYTEHSHPMYYIRILA